MKCYDALRILVFVSIAAVACGESQAGPADLEPASDTSIYRSRPHIVWSDTPHGLAPGIAGDGRSRDGSTGGVRNEYRSRYCGVWGELAAEPEGSGELAADVDREYTAAMAAACGPPRSMTIHAGGELGDMTIAPHFTVRNVAHLSVGESRSEIATFWLYHPNCNRIVFNSFMPGGNAALVTRLDDGSGLSRQWRIESQGDHMATCIRDGNQEIPIGAPFTLPFSFTVTELLYPFTRYP